jgi:DNA-directed RNA polymerase specialized sigma24 family protein
MEEILGIKEGALRVKMNRLKEKIRQRLNDTVYGT